MNSLIYLKKLQRMKNSFFIIIFLVLFILFPIGCKVNNSAVITEQSTETLLAGTIYETKAYRFKTNVTGLKILIIGGIHGDEVAGWKAATQLLDYDFKCGEIIILPKANILATQLEQRYPGAISGGVYDGVCYSDLNRSFPGNAHGSPTEKIADAIKHFIDTTNPDIVLDLHESRGNYENKYLGYTVICGNYCSMDFAALLVNEYNSKYQKAEGLEFITDSYPPAGSVNAYCAQDNERIVLTVETDRSIDVSERILQHIRMVQLALGLAETK